MNDASGGGSLFPSHPSLGRRIVWVASVAVVYFAAARLGLSLVLLPEGIAPIWLPAGIFLSALLLTRRDLRPALAAGLFVTDLIAELLAGTPPLVSALYALTLTGDAVLSCWLLTRFVGAPIGFMKAREVLGFLTFAVLLSNGLASIAAAGASKLIPGTSFWDSLGWWAASDGIGNLLVTPFLLTWASLARARRARWNTRRVLEGAGLFVPLALSNLAAFSSLSPSNQFPLLLPYVTFPFLLWAALRFGMRGVTAAMVILAAIAIPSARAGPHPSFLSNGPPLSDVIVVQLYLAILAIPSLFLAAITTERKRAEEELRERESRLCKAEEIARVGSWVLDLTTNRLTWSDEVYRIFGLSPQGFVATYEAFLEAVHPDDRSAVDAAYTGSLREGRDTYEIEHRVVRKSTGETRYVEERCEHQRDASHRVVRSVGMVHDITDRKRAEEALQESEQRFRSMFDDSPIALWEEDFSGVKARFDALRRAGVSDFRAYLQENAGEVASLAALVRVIQINKTSVRVLGAESTDQVFRDLPHSFAHESLEVFKEEMIALAEGRTRFRGEVPYLNARGEPLTLDMALAVQTGCVESLSRVLVSFMDVTERTRAEEALRERNRYIETLLENAPIGFAVNTIDDGRVVFVGSKFEEIYGLPRGSLRSVEQFFESVYRDPVIREEMRARIMADMATGEPARMRWESIPLTTAAGEKRFVTATNIPLLDQNLMVSTVQDVTARHRAEEALRESEERFRSLVEQAGDGFELLDAEGRYVDVNSATCRQLRYSREELLRMSIHDIDPAVSPEQYAARFRTLLSHPPITFETVHRRKDGTTFPVEITTSRIWLDNSTRALTLVRDITERKRAEQERMRLQGELVQAQKMESVGRLAGGVAHDFNNMLGVILGHADMTMEKLGRADPLRASLEEIRKAAQRSADLTRQLLGFARRQTVAPKVLDMNVTIAGMLDMLRRLIGEQIDLAWTPGAGLWRVKIDPSQIDQIVINLCVNSRDAIEGVGRISIESDNVSLDEADRADHPELAPGEYVRLIVSDSGRGMEKDVMEHLFEPFFTTKDSGKGTGLGLATVYGIVKQNEGFISVHSEPGKGTAFNVYLPRFDSGAEIVLKHNKGEGEQPRGGTETVLLVEDEAMILSLGAELLRSLGYRVLAAATPTEALALAASPEPPIHLLITDVVMPEMNGKDLRDRIAAHRPGVRTLFVSGYTADMIATHGVLEEGIEFLQKPFSLRALAAKARKILDSK